MLSLSGSNSADERYASTSPDSVSACSWPVHGLPCLSVTLYQVGYAIQEQPKVLAIKAWVAPISSIPKTHSYCSDVSRGIPLEIDCHCGCVTCCLNQFCTLVASAIAVVH